MTPSLMWNFFQKTRKFEATCIYCHKIVKTCGNTSNLKSHILRCHKAAYNAFMEQFQNQLNEGHAKNQREIVSLFTAGTPCIEFGETSTEPPEQMLLTNGSHPSSSSKSCTSEQGSYRKRIKLDAYSDVEECLFSWYIQACRQNIPVSDQILQEKATEFGHLLGYYIQQFNDAWISNLKLRKGITFQKERENHLVWLTTNSAPDELHERSTVTSPPFKSRARKQRHEFGSTYNQQDIFCMVEMGLLWNLLPDEKPEAWSSKIISSVHGDFSEDRISVIMAFNLCGTEKLPLVVIGSRSDESLVNNDIQSVTYIKNSSSWITNDIIFDWVHRLNQKMARNGRTIALVTENPLLAALKGKLSNINIFVRAPDSARWVSLQFSKVVNALKLRYRTVLLSHLLKRHKAEEDNTSDDFKESICWLASAWFDINPETYVSGVRETMEEMIKFNECENQIQVLCRLRNLSDDEESFSTEIYITFDDHVSTMPVLTCPEIFDVFRKYRWSPESINSDSFGSAGREQNLTLVRRESFIPSTPGENLASGVVAQNAVMRRPDSCTSNIDVTDTYIIPQDCRSTYDYVMAPLVNAENSEDLSFRTGSVLPAEVGCIELSFTVENSSQHASEVLALCDTEHKPVRECDVDNSLKLLPHHENPQKSSETDINSSIGLNSNSDRLCDDALGLMTSSELGTDLPSGRASFTDQRHMPSSDFPPQSSPHITDAENPPSVFASILPVRTDRATSPIEPSLLSHNCFQALFDHMSSNSEKTFSAAEALSSLMVVHSYIFSQPSIDDDINDSVCRLIRFLSNTVIEENQKRKSKPLVV